MSVFCFTKDGKKKVLTSRRQSVVIFILLPGFGLSISPELPVQPLPG